MSGLVGNMENLAREVVRRIRYMVELSRNAERIAREVMRRTQEDIIVNDSDVFPGEYIQNRGLYSKLINVLEEKYGIIHIFAPEGGFFLREDDYKYFTSLSEAEAESLDEKKRRAWKMVNVYNKSLIFIFHLFSLD